MIWLIGMLLVDRKFDKVSKSLGQIAAFLLYLLGVIFLELLLS
jgi:hypothetical protein